MTMRPSAVVIAYLLLGSPAAWACHKFRYWGFPWPQRCPVERRMIETPLLPPLPPILSRDGDIPLPNLKADWGGCPPDMKARLLLRAALDGELKQ